MKPISTLMSRSDGGSRHGRRGQRAERRSDVTAVAPAMGVIAEALTAFVLADACREFGGDSLAEMRRELRRPTSRRLGPAGPRSGSAWRGEVSRHGAPGGPPGGREEHPSGGFVPNGLPAPLLDIEAFWSADAGMPIAQIFG